MFQNIINIPNPPHAILINESKLCNLKELVNQYRIKINANLQYGFIELNGYGQTIKKEDIQNIIEKFSLSSYGDSSKLYVIYGVENTSPQAINSLLKFLEEPPYNTYAILTTRNINHVLPTIKSRCQVFRLLTDTTKLNELKNTFNLNDEQIKIAQEIYYDYESLHNDLSTKTFFKNYEDCKKLVENFKDVQIIKEESEKFKKMTYMEILLLLKFINCFVKTNVDLLKLIDSIKFTPSRSTIFNRL
jgi:DNA polymerase-3 subunit delta'